MVPAVLDTLGRNSERTGKLADLSASQWVANTIHGRIQLPREWEVPYGLEEGGTVN